MFHFLLIVLVLATGQMQTGVSQTTFPTMEACQAALPAEQVRINAIIANDPDLKGQVEATVSCEKVDTKKSSE
jgi:hypothetical protein